MQQGSKANVFHDSKGEIGVLFEEAIDFIMLAGMCESDKGNFRRAFSFEGGFGRGGLSDGNDGVFEAVTRHSW